MHIMLGDKYFKGGLNISETYGPGGPNIPLQESTSTNSIAIFKEYHSI